MIQNKTLAVTDTKFFVPFVAISYQDNAILLQ